MVLCLSQDGACTDSFENFRDNNLKGDLSNDISLTLPLFSLVNTFKFRTWSALAPMRTPPINESIELKGPYSIVNSLLWGKSTKNFFIHN